MRHRSTYPIRHGWAGHTSGFFGVKLFFCTLLLKWHRNCSARDAKVFVISFKATFVNIIAKLFRVAHETIIGMNVLQQIYLSSPRLMMFANGLLSTIFGSKKDEVTGELRRLHN